MVQHPQWTRASPFSRLHHQIQTHHARHSVGLLYMNDQPVTETSTLQTTTLTEDRQKFPRHDSNPQSQQANGCRPKCLTTRPLWSGLWWLWIAILTTFLHNRQISSSPSSLTLKMKVECSCETLEQTYGPSWCQNPEGYHLVPHPMKFPHRERPNSHPYIKWYWLKIPLEFNAESCVVNLHLENHTADFQVKI
jgi:hypothetical protein